MTTFWNPDPAASATVGTSKKNFVYAINEAVHRAGKTIRNVSGLDIVGEKAIVKNVKVVRSQQYRSLADLS